MKILLIICTVFATSCQISTSREIKKPFIIFDKHPSSDRCHKNFCYFQYLDANSNKFDFCEREDKYDIGDTIK